MKRREFGGLLLTAVAGLFVTGASMASGKAKTAAATSGAKEAAASAAASATNSNSHSTETQTPPSRPDSFFMTITTFFPYPMSREEYKTLLKDCRNIEDSDKLIADMKMEGKLLGIEAKREADKVISCFEFANKKAFHEYEERFSKIPGNSSKLKKQLGFRSHREYKKVSFA